MAACQEVRQWITQNILVPVTQFITAAREKCEELKQRIEEKVSQPVDQWVSRQEERCRELPWWNPLRWFCELVTIVVKVVVWVVVTVVKWVVTIVCQIVTVVIGIIVTLVLRVVGWFVTFVVCLFSDPLEALKSFRDLWTIVLDTVGEIFDLVDLLLGDVIDILTDVESLIDSLASSLGWLGVVLGIVKGLIGLVRDLVSVIRDAVHSLGDIVLGVLGGNLCRLLRGLTDLGTAIGRALLDTGFVVFFPLRVIGAAVGGVRDSVNQHQLEDVIRSAVARSFGAGSAREQRALEQIGINVRPMGLAFHADARRMFLSSNDRGLNLKALHDEGVINLHALAGHLSDCGRVINEPEGEVVYAGTSLHVSYADLETFLRDGPGSVPEFHVFAITRAKFRTHLETASRKAAALGVRLFFPVIDGIQATSRDHVPLNASEQTPPGDPVQQALFQRLGRTGVNDDLSLIPSISHFHYVPNANGNELFGLTSWFRPSDKDARMSGVTYRNRTPDWGFRFVLVHELGHYWGLDHKDRNLNDRSLDQIMYAPSTGVGIDAAAVLEYLLLSGEPRFTLDDARTAWDWITGDGAASLLP
jgi:hypothetical protein